MNKLIEKPHFIFLVSIPIIMLMGIFNKATVLDINISDTYYVIDYLYLTILISMLFGLIGIGYWIMQKTNRKLSNRLNWIHTVLTLGGTLLIWILTKFYQTEIKEYEFNNNLTSSITLIILLVILGQLIFPINIIYGLIKKKD